MDMRIKKSCLGMLAACEVLFGAARADAEVSVTDVTAVPRYPWNGLVDIQCTVSGSGGLNGWFEFAVAAVDAESGSVRDVTHFHVVRDVADADDKEVRSDGEHKLLWDARADLGEVIVSNMIVRVTVRARDKEGHTGVQLWEDGPYWAETNIGAEHPWEYGRYFWWGDTVGALPGEFSFSQANIPTYGKDIPTLQSEGWLTADSVLTPKYDAAHVQWGGGWRIPTSDELYELVSMGFENKCDWTLTTMNGVKGCVVRGRGNFAHASIFIPFGGFGWDGFGTSLYHAGSIGYLWSSTPLTLDHLSWSLLFRSGSREMDYNSRDSGYSIRPVRGTTE